MRPRIAVLLAVAVAAWVGWGVFIYHPAPNALPACVPNGELSCSTIDGFPIGRMYEDCPCSDAGDSEPIAVQSLDAGDGGHAPVAQTTIYDLDMARVCGPVLCAYSGSYHVFVFKLQDGGQHAVGVLCGVGGCQAIQSYGG